MTDRYAIVHRGHQRGITEYAVVDLSAHDRVVVETDNIGDAVYAKDRLNANS
jgi:hypothetical protein